MLHGAEVMSQGRRGGGVRRQGVLYRDEVMRKGMRGARRQGVLHGRDVMLQEGKAMSHAGKASCMGVR